MSDSLRSTLATAIAAEASLSSWTVYAEPPEQLVAGLSIIVSPRSPYITQDTLGTYETQVAVYVMVPRNQGPAMDLIDAALASLMDVVDGISNALWEGVTQVGIVDDLGGSSYTTAILNVTL